MLCWKAGCSDKLPVRFGEGWAETCIRKSATRRPSTLCHPPAPERLRHPHHPGTPRAQGRQDHHDLHPRPQPRRLRRPFPPRRPLTLTPQPPTTHSQPSNFQTFNLPTSHLPHPTSNPQPPTPNLPTPNLPRPTSNPPPPTPNPQPPTFQPATLNLQPSNLKPP
jgi:hypothetical protein